MKPADRDIVKQQEHGGKLYYVRQDSAGYSAHYIALRNGEPRGSRYHVGKEFADIESAWQALENGPMKKSSAKRFL